MGAITISRTTPALTGSITIDDAKINEIMRLFGQETIEGFSSMTPQQKANAIAAELYKHVKKVAWQAKYRELQTTRQSEDAAALEEL